MELESLIQFLPATQYFRWMDAVVEWLVASPQQRLYYQDSDALNWLLHVQDPDSVSRSGRESVTRISTILNPWAAFVEQAPSGSLPLRPGTNALLEYGREPHYPASAFQICHSHGEQLHSPANPAPDDSRVVRAIPGVSARRS
jgi:hypothetical protein